MEVGWSLEYCDTHARAHTHTHTPRHTHTQGVGKRGWEGGGTVELGGLGLIQTWG